MALTSIVFTCEPSLFKGKPYVLTSSERTKAAGAALNERYTPEFLAFAGPFEDSPIYRSGIYLLYGIAVMHHEFMLPYPEKRSGECLSAIEFQGRPEEKGKMLSLAQALELIFDARVNIRRGKKP